jgi:hypothetical protein
MTVHVDPTPRAAGWLLLVYRVPSEPSSNRVSVWRELKRMGALYLQQCVCIVPHRPHLRADIDSVREKITRLGGSSNLFQVPDLPAEEEGSLIAGFRDLVAQQYAEIVEECETKFVKEVEFEHFRQNYTYAEAEEIEQDLDKIRRWYARVQERDWCGAPGRAEVDAWIERCTELLDGFYAEVHTRAAGNAAGPDAAEVPQPLPRLAPVRPTAGPALPPSPRRRKGGRG